MIVELKFFAADGTYEGSEFIGDRPKAEIDQIAIGTFGDGGHAEVWRENIRIFDDPATNMGELEQQVTAAAVAD